MSCPTRWAAHIGETCVTTTWIQLNLQLLRLTGEAKYGNELERSFYNHLAAAQHPRGDDWCYYTALEGKKPYDSGITCCHSSGPRGMALAVQAAYLKTKTPGTELLVINSFEDSQLELELDGQKVSLTQSSQFPRAGEGTLTFHMAKPATFGLLVRVPKWVKGPPWTSNFKLTVNDQPNGSVSIGGYARVRPREWKDGDHVKLTYRLGPRLIVGHFGNTDRAALAWGPFVLAYDQAMNPGLPSASAIGLVRESTELTLQPGPSLAFRGPVVGRKDDSPRQAVFVPFADAGSTGGDYRVWLCCGRGCTASVLAEGRESRSRQGRPDGDHRWRPVQLRGHLQWRSVGDGRRAGWISATTATNGSDLEDGQAFECRLGSSVSAVAVRVLGVPSRGDDANQAFSSCGELEAFPNETRSSFRFVARTEGEERDQERPSRLTDGRRHPPGVRRVWFDRPGQ